jgi:hypothetical protein
MLIKWILSGYLIVPIGSPLLGSFQSSGQHLDGYIAAASQFLPVCLHILLPENQRYILIFWKNARTQKTDSNHIYEILSQLSPCKQNAHNKSNMVAKYEICLRWPFRIFTELCHRKLETNPFC